MNSCMSYVLARQLTHTEFKIHGVVLQSNICTLYIDSHSFSVQQ